MDKKSISVGFKLHKITTEQFAVISGAFDKNIEDIDISIGLEFGLDKAHKIITSFVLVQFLQKKTPFLILEVANHYSIEENAWNNFVTNNENVTLPQGFASHLAVLTIGTARGVLHGKTENTEFNKFVLPTINVTELIKTDIELSLEI